MPRKKETAAVPAKIKDPVLLIVTNASHSDEYNDGSPSVCLIEMSVPVARKFLERQKKIRALTKSDPGLRTVSGVWYPKYYKSGDTPNLFPEQEIEDLTGYELDGDTCLSKVMSMKELEKDYDKVLNTDKSLRIEASQFHLDSDDLNFTAYSKYSNDEYSTEYLSTKLLERFVKEYSK